MGPKRGPLRPVLPADLLEKVGGYHASPSSSKPFRSRRHPQTRKDRRKQDRSQRGHRDVPKRTPSGPIRDSTAHGTPVKPSPEHSPNSSQPKQQRITYPAENGNGLGGFSHDQDDDESEDDKSSKQIVSEATKNSREDTEIAELERKLGIKNRNSRPKYSEDDGLSDILGELDDNDDGNDGLSDKKKRKAEADDWLAEKRRKAMHPPIPVASDNSDDDLDGIYDFMNESDLDCADHLDARDEDDRSLGPDAPDGRKPARKRENPYMAPTTSQDSVQKYVPPARRQESGSDAELLSRIRRQMQGLINRLTESNLLVILGGVEKLCREYPRQHVTSILIDLLLVQICEPTSLPDTLLILYAGFSTATYQVLGPDFGAQLIQSTVERFKKHRAHIQDGETQQVAKYTSNLITFLSQIYNFQLIGCTLVFDYIRTLLSDLSELNAELLLRIVRMAGQSLRRDDPSALKDIVNLIGPAVKKVGEANLSVRTKFLIESINDLKNNKVKTGASASAIVQEHTTQIKKLLGSMNARNLKATEPLRIGLKDIEESDKRGKWWLVGARWAGRDENSGKQNKGEFVVDEDDESDSIAMGNEDEVMPDLLAIAREQNMNTDVRRSIFIAIMSSSDYEDAYGRLVRLRLNKHRQKEIAYVLMQCVGCEKQYNPYYSLVARRVCGDSRIKFAFQDSLWKFLRRLGESPFGEDADDEEEDETIDARRILNVAKMFGYLLASGSLALTVLKCVNLAYIKPKARDLIEIMLNTLFLEVDQAGNNVSDIFGAVADIQELSQGLQYFLKKRTQKSGLIANKKDGTRIKKAAQRAIQALRADLKVPKMIEVEEERVDSVEDCGQ